jgi:phage-related protein
MSYQKKVKTMMVNNSTSINKANNYISPQLIELEKRPQHMTLEFQDLAWDRQ